MPSDTPYILSDEDKEHMREVDAWLDEHVTVYPQPAQVRLHDFQVDWGQLSGSFWVALDGVSLDQSLAFSLNVTGYVDYSLPMFHSPLGAPCSYAAIDLTPDTKLAITRALRLAIPRIRGAGLDPVSGAIINAYTAVSGRVVDPAAWEAARVRLSDAAYAIEMDVPFQR